MRITIENTSSPGASFTDNTNDVLLEINEWILSHPEEQIPFIEFRRRLQKEKGINDNNNRNIFPLLRNCGMVNYESGEILTVKNFFSNTGKAYVTALETRRAILSNMEYSQQQKMKAIEKIDNILSDIVYAGLEKLVKADTVNYVEPFQNFIQILCKFNSICKPEYAYFLFERKSKSFAELLPSFEKNLHAYRNGQLDFEIEVTVRNDINLRKYTKSDKRQESLSFLTSYGYFISLLLQANLIVKDGKYYRVISERKHDLELLIQEA